MIYTAQGIVASLLQNVVLYRESRKRVGFLCTLAKMLKILGLPFIKGEEKMQV